MPQEETEALHELFSRFQVVELGQGDTNLGANVLASMAGVLANLAPANGTVVTADNRPARLGMNLLISGSASSGQVIDEVITEVGRRQRNLSENLRHYTDWIKKQEEKFGGSLPPMGPGSNRLVDDLAETQAELEPLFARRTQVWSRILNEVPTEQVTDLARCPKFLVTCARPGDLESQLQGLRPGPPLVHLGLRQPGDLATLADPGAALVEGRFTHGNSDEAVRANMVITDSMKMLGEAAKVPDPRTAWLGHFLWLCDGEAGPEAPTGNASDVPEETTERFRRALDRVITLRLNVPEKTSIVLGKGTREATVRWMTFLHDMEPRLPGISGAARNLIASLIFGLSEMAVIDKRFSFPLAGVEAFARFLVRRMANSRAMILQAGAVAQRRAQIERVFWKLQQGPTEPRGIYKNLNRLPANDCKECLRWMEQAGISRRVGGQWELVEGARLSFNDCSTPVLEV